MLISGQRGIRSPLSSPRLFRNNKRGQSMEKRGREGSATEDQQLTFIFTSLTPGLTLSGMSRSRKLGIAWGFLLSSAPLGSGWLTLKRGLAKSARGPGHSLYFT